jgi:uncharacterized protein YggE
VKTKVTLLALLALAAPLLLAVACGGDGEGDGESTIRTQKGLAVAALATGAGLDGGGEEAAGIGGDSGPAVGAPAPQADAGVERGVAVAPGLAPVPFPLQQEGQTGVTVQGFGSASVDADGALLELYFNGQFIDGIEPFPEPQRGQSEPGADGVAPGLPEIEPLGEGQQITEADLQPVVDAIAAQGVPGADIEVIIDPLYGDYYFGGSASIRVTVSDVDVLDGIVDAATEAAAGLDAVSFGGNTVSYTVADCAALEQAAMQAAVEDARQRGQSFASVLGVGLGPVAGASHYSYSPFGGSPCDFDYGGVYPVSGVTFAEGQASEVQLIATVTITFAMQ